MENRSRYNLDAATENWRQELAAQPNLTADVRVELETHLRDAMAGFHKLGMDEEESFWLARRRVGSPQQLEEEFVKANPASVWRKRILWMSAAGLLVALWSLSVNVITSLAFEFAVWSGAGRNHVEWRACQNVVSLIVRDAPIVYLAFLLAKGRGRIHVLFEAWFASRSRVIRTGLGWLAANEVLFNAWMFSNGGHFADVRTHIATIWFNVVQGVVLTAAWPLALIAVIAWLMKAEQSKSPVAA